MIGLPIVLGRNQSPHRIFIQIKGHGWRLPAGRLSIAMETSVALRTTLLGYANDFMVQLAQTVRANGRSRVPARLARWILMCRDRIDDEEIPMTHEFLGLMLGIRRAGVTEALADLEGKGIIQAARGKIRVKDWAQLTEIAGSIYKPNHSMPEN
jgi:CRP-like cAMP-binding protein